MTPTAQLQERLEQQDPTLILELLEKITQIAQDLLERRSITSPTGFHDPYEVAHEVLRRLIERPERLANIAPERLNSYLHVVVRNLLLDKIRRDEHHQRSLASGTDFPKSPDEQFTSELQVALVRDALQELDVQGKRILTLYLQGRTNNEIARLLNLTPSAVRIRKYRSLKQLRNLLEHKLQPEPRSLGPETTEESQGA